MDGHVAFWMKNTLVPLDMIFIDSGGTVRKILANVPVVVPGTPDGKIPRERGLAQYVIELPVGEATRDGIKVGTRLRIITRHVSN
ncbi:MAG: DUF192 domain-containing protein [Candidatus Tyrphobacter sp.]